MSARERILAAVEGLQEIIKFWDAECQNSKRYDTIFKGRIVKMIPVEFDEALAEIETACQGDDIQLDTYELALACDSLIDQHRTWQADCVVSQASGGQGNSNPNGSDDLWRAYNLVISKIKPYQRVKAESIESLRAEPKPVPYAQIAKIYGWLDENGNPDVNKVAEEIQQPGKHFDPKTWMHKNDKKYFEELAERWKNRQQVQKSNIAAKNIPKPVAPESLDDLIVEGVSAEQIAKMKKVSVDAVYERASAMGVKVGVRATGQAKPKVKTKSDHEAEENEASETAMQEIADAKVNTHPELKTIDKRIEACFLDGMEAKDIYRVFNKIKPGLSFASVEKVIGAVKGA